MSYTWTAPSFKRQLAANIRLISGLNTTGQPEVRVTTYAVSLQESLTDIIVIGSEATDDNEQVILNAAARPHDEVVTLACGIRVIRPGAGEEVAQSAEDRLIALLAHVTDEVHTNAPDVGRQTLGATVTGRRLETYPTDVGGTPVRVAEVEFQIVYTARTDATN